MPSLGTSRRTYRPFPTLSAGSGSVGALPCAAVGNPSLVQSSDQTCTYMMNCTVTGYAGDEGVASLATLAVEWRDSGGCVIRNRAAGRRMIWPLRANHRGEKQGELDTAGAQRITHIAVASFWTSS